MSTLNAEYTAPDILTSGAAWSDVKAGGLANIIEKVLAANAGTSNPTVAPTATATGGGSTGGSLAAGTYFLKFTEVNGVGETTAAPESAQLTVAATNQPQVTFPALQTGNTARNLYVTPVNGSSGTEVLYAENITTTTFVMTAAAPTSTITPPTANTTGISQSETNRVRSFKAPNLCYNEFVKASQIIHSYISGDPSAQSAVLGKLNEASVAFHVIAQALDDIGNLISANPGTLSSVQVAGGDYTLRRVV